MTVRIMVGDAKSRLAELAAESVDCCLTSPPYLALRSYLPDGHPDKEKEVGFDQSLDDYVGSLVDAARGVRRVLKPTGVFWLNIGDSYATNNTSAASNEHPSRRQKGTDVRDGLRPKRTLGGPPSARSTLRGNGHVGGGPKIRSLPGVEQRTTVVAPGLKPKDLMLVPFRVADALQADGWWLRSAVVWAKPNGMPSSQEDRPTSSYEMIFMLTRSAHYYSDFDAIKTPPRESSLIRTAQDVQAQAGSHRANGGAKTNGPHRAVGMLTGAPHGRHALGENVPPRERRSDKQRGQSRRHAGFNERWDAMERSEQMARPAMIRDVWFVPPASYSGAHFAVMPDEIARRCILAGSPPGGLVLDPFAGVGTTGKVADALGRDSVLIELNPDSASQAEARIRAGSPLLASVELVA